MQTKINMRPTSRTSKVNLSLVKRGLLIALVSSLTATPFSGVVRAVQSTDTPQFISSISKKDTAPADGAFSDPYGIAHDSSGNIFVVDRTNDRIQKFSANGAYIAKWGSAGSGNGQFDAPQGIAIDTDDNVYVTDRKNGRVQKFLSNGTYVTQWGENDESVEMDSLGVSASSVDVIFKRPSGIATDAANNVYVADANNHIQKFSSDGTFITEWGTNGNGDGEFRGPQGIAVDLNGDVYVADSDNNRIQKFSGTGNYIMKWGVYGQAEGEFANPWGVAIDASNNVYVTDTYNYRIQKFSSSGTYISQWGEYGGSVDATSVRSHRTVLASTDVGNGTFSAPRGIILNADNEVYVADSNDYRIQKFSSSGTYISQWGEYGSENKAGTSNGEFNTPTDAATDSSGNLYVVDRDNSRIQKFSSNGSYITQWGSQGSGNGQFQYPNGIAIDTQDNVYVSDSDNYRIQKFTKMGAYISQWGTQGSGDGEFGYAIGVVTDGNNNVYVVDSDGNRIQKFSSNGTYITQWGTQGSGDGEFNYPLGIASDMNNNIYVADTNNDRIQKFSSDGSFIAKWGEPRGTLTDEGIGGPYSSLSNEADRFHRPNDVTIDNDGNVYVMDTGSGRVQKLSTDGTYLTMWGEGDSVIPFDAAYSMLGHESEFNNAWGISTDKNGNVYVVDTGNHRVQKFGYVSTTELTQPGGSKKVVLQTPLDVTVNASHVVAQQSIQKKDAGNQYPMGLVDFNLSVPAGSTQQVSLMFETDLKPTDVIARKYYAAKSIYSNLPGANVVETTVDGKHALQLTYSITDGGNLDDDGVVNGVIVDPVGLAVGAGAPGAPNSGAGTTLQWAILPVSLIALVITIRSAYARGLLRQRNTTV